MPNTVPMQPATNQPQVPAPTRKPNESGTISVQAHMKIFDPATNKVYVEGRA